MSSFQKTTFKFAVVFALGFFCISSLVVTQELPVADQYAPNGAEENNKHSKKDLGNTSAMPILWRDPTDLESRDLLYGPGGQQDAPRDTVFTYEQEDLKGTAPKFDVRDRDGMKWRIKLGEEARPETAATRLLWAVGYFTDEDYFVPKIQVTGMRPVSKHRRKRASGLLEADGIMHNVRLKRRAKGEKKLGTWRWRENPFTGTRELNGLRVMMALMNNWDLTDENNAVVAEKNRNDSVTNGSDPPESDPRETIYEVSDLGASFGTAGRVRQRERAKGNLESYRGSKFIQKIGRDYVDFNIPARESWPLAVNPKEYTRRLHLRWIGQHIPRADVRWIGQLLSRLSREQIADAFRAADYPPDQVEAFTGVVQQRISQLNDL